MSRSLFVGMLALGIAGCAGAAAKDTPQDASRPAAAGGNGTGKRTAPALESLASGTRVDAVIENALSSRTNKPGETFRATVSRDVTDDRGRVVIPSGSLVTLTIVQLEPGSDQVRPDGRLLIDVSSITINGETHAITADLEPVTHHFQGRGITTDEAARVGAGTAIGAIAGQIIGKNTRSTTIGGAIGAVAGTAVAVRYAYRDIVVSAGTPIAFTLTQSLNVSPR